MRTRRKNKGIRGGAKEHPEFKSGGCPGEYDEGGEVGGV